MPKTKTMRHLFVIISLTLLALIPLGCSDDDPSDPGGGNPVDTTSPLVVDINPGYRDTGVPLDAVLRVEFSEPMDPATVAANITLDQGGFTDLTWNTEGTIMTLTHRDWPEGARVTLAVGIGMTDVAGNALPQVFDTTFFTYSSTPVLLDITLPGGADAMIPNASPVFLFSNPMDLLSVYNNTTVTEAPPLKAVPEFRVGTVGGDLQAVEIEFLQPLDALTTYTITIGTGAQTNGGTPLGQPAVATFTTGGEIDGTGPRILSVWPAVDAVVPTDLATVTVTFTEPVDPDRLRPTEMSALLELFMAREPVWNAAGDRMTLYLQYPLPAGVRLYGVFDESSIYDLVGNSNTVTDSVSFTTAGTASLFPVRSDLKIYYYASGMGPYSMVRQSIENIAGSTFERLLTRWDGTGFSDVQDHWRMSRGGHDLLLNGFIEDSGTVTFSPALTFLTLPVLAQWSGTSTGANDEGAFTMAYTAVADGPYRERFNLDRAKAPDSGTYFDGCYTVEIQYSLTAAGAATPFETGEIITYYTPGLGIYALDQYGYEYDGDIVVDDWEDSYWLMGAALDDRYENPR